ncbi:MAG: hypothetical protein HC853_03030 [Anaerolineae bacterium]|nr:hypothetical protein [Anaerolineae bacterium]
MVLSVAPNAESAEDGGQMRAERSQQQPGSKPSSTADFSELSPQDQAESHLSQSSDGAGQTQSGSPASDASGQDERGGVDGQSDSEEGANHDREEEEKDSSRPGNTTESQREDSGAHGDRQQQPRRQTKKRSDKKVKAGSGQSESDREGEEKPHAKRQGGKSERTEMTPAELNAWAAQIRQQCQRQVQQIQKNFGDVLSVAIQEALNDNTPLEAVQTLTQWGLEAGQEQYLPVERKIEIARHIGRLPKLAQIAKLWGRARASAMQMRSSQSDNAHIGAPWGFTVGDDPSRLDDEGLAMLDTPLEESVLSDLAMQSARLNRLKGRQALAQGPLIYCGDESSSMNAHFLEGFTREEWSKGFCLGLMDIAILQRRAFTMISFGSAYEIKTRVYPDLPPNSATGQT